MSTKTTVQIKVDKNLNRVFNGHAQIKGESKQDAHEVAMQLYVDKCEKNQRSKKDD